MAKQHFYSRVPAKMSMFNKMDSYDTFAHSNGITREQIEQELSVVCDIKPNKDDIALIKSCDLPTVYCQFCTQSKTLIQSAISFIKSDYTGERSSYMVHSAVFSDEEKNNCFNNDYNAQLVAEAFKTDIDSFDITNPDSLPDSDYPELVMPVKKAPKTEIIAEKYDTGMVKRLIYALIGIPCGKTKTLFLSLASNLADFSDNSLSFLNTVLQIFPYHMRESMSFITYVNDIAKFPGFKIKCIPETVPNAPNTKGITLKMDMKDYSGISDENVNANAMVVDFFYYIMKNDDVRCEFFKFCDYAVSMDETFKKVSLKNLNDLVLIFKCLSGHFEEKNILPNDDAVYNFINIYSKNRNAVLDEYRSRAMNFLLRYKDAGEAIPKNVFAKVVSLYPDENSDAKKVAMSVALELIHTDAMREKLFNFIKQSYDFESAETKADIMNSLCRVYYGGFLQEPIISFFDSRFADEPDEIKTIILDKLFLTVRTPKVQGLVIDFINKHFDALSNEQSENFYKLFYEMLPEGDSLSRHLADVVDSHIDDSKKADVKKYVLKILTDEHKKGNMQIISAISQKCGFIESVVIEKILSDWCDDKAFEVLLEASSKKDLAEKIETVKEIYKICPDIDGALFDKILSSFETKDVVKIGLFELIDEYDSLSRFLTEYPDFEKFSQKLTARILNPVLNYLIPSAFDYKRYPDGIARLKELASTRDDIKSIESFGLIDRYESIITAINNANIADSFISAEKFTGKALRISVAELIKRQFSGADIEPKSIFTLQMTVGYLKYDTLTFAESGNCYRDAFIRSDGNDSSENSEANADENVVSYTISAGAELYDSAISEELKEKILTNGCELAKCITVFINKNSKGKKFVLNFVDRLSADAEFKQAIIKFTDTKKSQGGFLKKLFKK